MVREGSSKAPGIVFPARGSRALLSRPGGNLLPNVLEENLRSWICLLSPKKRKKW